MSDVTEADRERARQLLRSIAVGAESTTVEIVAAALAEEREKAHQAGWEEGYRDGMAEGLGDT